MLYSLDLGRECSSRFGPLGDCVDKSQVLGGASPPRCSRQQPTLLFNFFPVIFSPLFFWIFHVFILKKEKRKNTSPGPSLGSLDAMQPVAARQVASPVL